MPTAAKDSLGLLCIRKVLVVWSHRFHEVRVSLHIDECFDIAEINSNNGIIIGNVRKLVIIEFPHQKTSDGGIVGLFTYDSIMCQLTEESEASLERFRGGTHHRPTNDTILNHEILNQWCMYLTQVMVVFLFAKSRFPITKN